MLEAIMTEKQWIAKILEGDSSAFNIFVNTYQDMAISIAYRICRNRQDAEDIVQNAFVKAYRSLTTFRSDSKFSTWFYRIVYNTAVAHIRVSVFVTDFVDYQVVDNQEDSDWDTLAIIDRAERKLTINKAMDKIPEGESLILTLFYLEENSIKDIQEITGLSEQNIKVRLHRGRKSLLDAIRAIAPHYITA